MHLCTNEQRQSELTTFGKAKRNKFAGTSVRLRQLRPAFHMKSTKKLEKRKNVHTIPEPLGRTHNRTRAGKEKFRALE